MAAAIVLRPDASVTPEQLRAYVKARVAAYKYPRLVWFTDALPKGPTGKILKREIRFPAANFAVPAVATAISGARMHPVSAASGAFHKITA